MAFYFPLFMFLSICRQLCKNNKVILSGEYMHSDCWTLGWDFGEILEMVRAMTKRIHQFTPQNFRLENLDGAKTTVLDIISYYFYYKHCIFCFDIHVHTLSQIISETLWVCCSPLFGMCLKACCRGWNYSWNWYCWWTIFF